MMKYAVCLFIMIFLSLTLNSPLSAAIQLNEIYPAPGSGEEEWVELYNNDSNTSSLTTYTLNDLANNSILLPATEIGPLGTIVVVSTNILNNSGDTLTLKNNSEVIETVSYSGNFSGGKSYTRCPDGNGQWFSVSTPTRNQINTSACLSFITPTPTTAIDPTPTPTASPTASLSPTDPPPSPSLTPAPTMSPSPTITPTPTPVSYSNILISEVLVYPENNEPEWVELYNSNDYSVNLTDWYIDDNENSGSTPKSFSLLIAPKNYAVIDISSNIFNNNGDSVRLLDSNQLQKDILEYSTSTKDRSWGRISETNTSYCEQNPSKSQVNSSCLTETTNSLSITSTPTPTPTIRIIITSYPTIITTSFTRQPNLKVNFPINLKNLTNNPNSFDKQSFSESLVLGASTQNNSSDLRLVKSLSLISSSLPLLCILSLLLKICKDRTMFCPYEYHLQT